jgi:hypothetical protein
MKKSDTSDYNCIPFSASQPLLISSLSGNVAFVNQTRWQWRILNSKPRTACQYPHFAQTEDIWLKSALEEKRGVLLITGSNMASGPLRYLKNNQPNCP